MSQPTNADDAIHGIGHLLQGIIRRHPDVKEDIAEITAMLDFIGREMRQRHRPVQRRTGVGVRYTIEMVGGRQMLYEHRPAGQPLRVSREIFDAFITVMASSSKALAYEDIAEGMEKLVNTKLVEWQGRLVLRFMQRAEPAIVVRERSRYRAADPKRFSVAAQKFWRTIARS